MFGKMSETPSIVLTLTAADNRLIGLGFDQLVEKDEVRKDDPVIAAGEEKLGAHIRVIHARAEIRRAETQLVDSSTMDYERALSSRPRDEDAADVRLTLPVLAKAERGLELFLERENPRTDPFAKTDPPKLIDPPEKVKKTLVKISQAKRACERMAELPQLEADALA